MRTPPLLTDPIAIDPDVYTHMASPWKAMWVGPETYDSSGTHVFAYRLHINNVAKTRIHVSADQRYILFLDGKRIGRGPERGDQRHWMYDSYDLDLTAAQSLVAITWWISPFAPTQPAEAQQTVRPAFLVYAEGPNAEQVSTGSARWEIKSIPSIQFTPSRVSNAYYAVDPRIILDGHTYPWGVETGHGVGWKPVTPIHAPAVASRVSESNPHWLLRPAMLPEMQERQHVGAIVRHVEAVNEVPTTQQIILEKSHLPDEAIGWSKLLAGEALVIPPRTRRRVIVDLKDYVCAFSAVTTTGGLGSSVRLSWAESLVTFDPAKDTSVQHAKLKKRNEVHNQHFVGYGDTFITDGGDNRQFDPLWWAAGRYIEVIVQTQDQPLTINRIDIVTTGYPYHFEADFQSSDPRLAKVIPLALRTLRMCSHETSMDCPYYEQLNYAGDTRLQSLVAMSYARDDRLVRKGIKLFDWSRTGDTWTSSRWPSRVVQTIPPFAMWWVGMVYDYALYRGDRAFVLGCMPGVRAIIERWREQIDDGCLVRMPMGWNFVDWVKQWPGGVPNMKPGSACGVLQWQVIYTLKIAAELETMMNEPLLAQRHVQTASALAASAERAFFNAKRGLLANDLEQKQFSEHAQVLALISGNLSQPLREKVASALITPPGDLAETSIYFSHYTFEALQQVGRIDTLVNRMEVWFEHEAMGMYTLLESPEPSRSDCHAWGAHPLHHYFASILGIRPASFGFEKVVVRPQLGPLESATGTMVHPLGMIHAEFARHDDNLKGEVILPAGVRGECHINGRVIGLESGSNVVA